MTFGGLEASCSTILSPMLPLPAQLEVEVTLTTLALTILDRGLPSIQHIFDMVHTSMDNFSLRYRVLLIFQSLA